MNRGVDPRAARFAPVEPQGMRFPWLWIGTWSMGGSGYGRSDLGESARVLQNAFEAGIRHFDTAGFYARGQSEALIARALEGKRRSLFLATKGGLVWEGNRVRHSASPGALRRTLEESLARLGTDYVDLYQLHWPDPAVPLAESIGALRELQAEGLTRFFGVCNLSAAEIAGALEPGGLVPHQVHHNPLHRAPEILDAGRDGGRCANLIISPLEQGLLAGERKALGKRDVRRRNRHFNDPEALLWADRLRVLAGGAPVPQAALVLLWILSDPRVDAVIPGPRTQRQLEELLAMDRWIAEPFAERTGHDLWHFLGSRKPVTT